jgi:hypothetical protein
MERIEQLLRQDVKPIKQAIKNQEKWRQKQIVILYKTGRPIFFIEKYKYRFFYL